MNIGSAIYFSIDFDADQKEMEQFVIPYFQGLRQAFLELGEGNAPYTIGAFGSGLVTHTLFREGLCQLRWLSGDLSLKGSS